MSIEFGHKMNDGICVNLSRTIRIISPHITSMKSVTGIVFGHNRTAYHQVKSGTLVSSTEGRQISLTGTRRCISQQNLKMKNLEVKAYSKALRTS